jgi:glutamate-ammonia-ligase adenylyltransferase
MHVAQPSLALRAVGILMQLDQLRQCLESPQQAHSLLHSWRLRDDESGCHNLTCIGQHVGLDALRDLCTPLGRLLPRCPDADMALNNLERFLAQPAGRDRLAQLFENRARTLEVLLQLFSNSQSFSDQLVAHPGFLDMVRLPLRKNPSTDELQQQFQTEIDACYEDSAVLRAFRRFRQGQILRIGTNDIIRERSLEEITHDISRVADVALEVALTTALRKVGERFGQPFSHAGEPARCVILAFGKLGGEELNYSSDIDLMFVYDEDGGTRGQRGINVENSEFFSRVVSEVLRLLTTHTDNGVAYRVDLRLRPDGPRGPLARSLASTLAYYDTFGRTWERQALIKLRPVAGDLALGRRFLAAVEPFIYRRYLNFAEINGIKALKRKIEQRTAKAGESDSEVKTGHGGIRDIEFTIQFLQLLNGGDLPEVRQRNTLLAMEALEAAGCLTDQEDRALDDAYRFLRKVEHRLQILFDLQVHRLPEGRDELRKLALRMGYTNTNPDSVDEPPPVQKVARRSDDPPPFSPEPQRSARQAFLHDYREKTGVTHAILDHLLHQTFESDTGQPEPEADLVLDPDPDPETLQRVLGKYGFQDVQGAYHNLMQLARESVPFLSTRRCRHFLASIAARLLAAVAATPDPDLALVNLEKVTASLGAKSVLWELFSFNPPSLKLYVDLCAWSHFLSGILINNPGMIDELLDTLVLNQPRSAQELREELEELCRGASQADAGRSNSLELILHSFQDKELLRIGVRDILAKDDTRATTAALTELAETLLARIASLQYPLLEKRFGIPYLSESHRASRYVLLGFGKLGAGELNYHSDLDIVLVYEGDGKTGPPASATRFDRFESTDNFHFFTELAQRIIKAASYQGPMGRLYQIDMRLRPTGKSGSLVIPLAEFRRYYDEGGAQLWERQALTRVRVVFGDVEFASEVISAVESGGYGLAWKPEMVDEVLTMRRRLETSRTERDLKRGFGGLVDIEFLVQLFQLKYGGKQPSLRTPNTWQALEALREAELLTNEQHTILRDSYSFLQRVLSRLRIVHNRSLDELPQSAEEVEKLARRLGFEGAAGELFLTELERHTRQTRELFLRLLARERDNP